ncbi:divalent-cation tolerance protein CutA [Parachlamydia sp. AcF125]|uniref:divalent-cation tolerance protein CutA n=1 Tax=Parachlamydia sp. AcF125 TaxID=2795736 RepID=UPI001BCA3158|nr:divalent-cation tolerance protein CutA [Parachlamydia sp. AcF125]MBS4168507.1 Divalent-cation tolerance protein CutA [Parachlamydia sp. AcF125]
MTTFIEVHWTSGSIEEARQVSRYLVQEQLVACAQIIPSIESFYMWNNQLETALESKVVFKTRLEKFEKIKEAILKNCSYQIPEITYQVIQDGNREYLEWLKTSIPDF